MMPFEADFCGDRLRLAAFLRVVGDGMPQRPTRFRRRIRVVDNGPEVSSQLDSDCTDIAVDLDQRDACEEPSDDVSTFGIVRSPTPGQLFPAPGELALGAKDGSQCQRDCRKSDRIQLRFLQQVKKCASNTTAPKSPNMPRKILSTRKRRRLPLNRLVLMRTTSSDGLPQPSDADHILAAPIAAFDPIEDNQVALCAPSTISSSSLASYRVQKHQKQASTSVANNASRRNNSVWMLRGRSGHPSSARLKGARRKELLGSSFAISSDGFVGAELSTQHTSRSTKLQANNRVRVKKASSVSGGLILAYGHLPAPLVEHHLGVLPQSERNLHAGDRMPSQAQTGIHERQRGSQLVPTEVRSALSDEETRERRDYDLKQHESLIRNQLSSITAPIRRVSEGSSSDSSDGECIRSNGLGSSAHDPGRYPHTLPLARMPTSVEDTRYSEDAMYNLDAPDRSDSVDGEFWSQYPELDHSDECWIAESSATGSAYYT